MKVLPRILPNAPHIISSVISETQSPTDCPEKSTFPILMEVPLIADGANDGDESALHGLPSKRQSKPCPKTYIRFPVAKNLLAADDDTCYLNLKSAGVHEINSSDDSMSSNCSKINWSESDQLTLQSVEVLCTQCRKQLAGSRSKREISREESIHGLQLRAERVLSFVNLVCFLGDGKSIYSHFGGINYVSKEDKSDPNHAENGVGRTSIDSQNLAEALKVCQTKLGYGTGFLWIKIHDISDLTDIASAFSLDEFIVASFKNLRAQSDFFLTEKGFLLSICSFQLSENAFRKDDLDPQSGAFSKNQCSMKKLCIYAEDDIVLSYEFDMVFQLDGTVAVTSLHPTDYIVADAEKNREVYHSTGKGYLIGKLIEKSFSLQDSLFESCHDGLSYYSQQVRSLHTDNMKMRGDSLTGFLSHEVVSVRVLQIEYCILLLQAYLLEAVGVISECCEKSRVKNKTWELKIGPSLHRTRGTANCAASSLQQGLLAASHLRKTLNTIVHMRERRMGIVLSLFAAVFLPLTFLTGVFGMNFQLDANYSMDILNDPKGPVYFAFMCIGVVLCSHFYFVSNFWVEPLVNVSRFWNRTARGRHDKRR